MEAKSIDNTTLPCSILADLRQRLLGKNPKTDPSLNLWSLFRHAHGLSNLSYKDAEKTPVFVKTPPDTSSTSRIHTRFKEADWYTLSDYFSYVMLGAGGIGSNTAYYIAKTLPGDLWIIDMDKVEPHNIGTQFFSLADLDKFKTDALVEFIRTKLGKRNVRAANLNINGHDGPWTGAIDQRAILITGFDNMKARSDAYFTWKNYWINTLKYWDTLFSKESNLSSSNLVQNFRYLHSPIPPILIDGRLNANEYEILVVTFGDTEAMRVYEEEFLFDDSEALEEPCTLKQTPYSAGLIGARITQYICAHIENAANNMDLISLPFRTKEILPVGQFLLEEVSDYTHKKEKN